MSETKMLDPQGLASQLFDIYIIESKGDPITAVKQVIGFLSASLVYAVSTIAGNDETARKGILKEVGESIINAPQMPTTGASGKP